MTHFLRLAAVPVVLALVLTGAGIGASAAKDPAAAGLACGLKTTPAANGMMDVAAVISSPAAVSGSYQFRIRTSGPGGNSDQTQGSSFALEAGRSATLVTLTMNANATFDAAFSVNIGGTDYDCTRLIS